MPLVYCLTTDWVSPFPDAAQFAITPIVLRNKVSGGLSDFRSDRTDLGHRQYKYGSVGGALHPISLAIINLRQFGPSRRVKQLERLSLHGFYSADRPKLHRLGRINRLATDCVNFAAGVRLPERQCIWARKGVQTLCLTTVSNSFPLDAIAALAVLNLPICDIDLLAIH